MTAGLKMRRILFVTWDGPQVNYLESLYAPVFARLENHGFAFDILQFRWGDETTAREIDERFSALGMRYRAVPIRRTPPAIGPFFSALWGGSQVRKAVQDFGSDVIMPRSLMPALAILAANGPRHRPVVFDADGLQADERVEFQNASRFGLVYRILRFAEGRMVREAKSVLVRSEFAASVLAERSKVSSSRFHVIGNGRDEDLFKPGSSHARRNARCELGLGPSTPLLAYAGSVGAQYRFDMIAKTAAAVREGEKDARLLVLTPSPEKARRAIFESVPDVIEMTTIRTVSGEQVPHFLAAADMGLSFRARTFSTGAVSPIKTGEYLLCGVPVFGTAGIGDTKSAERAGVFRDEAVGPSGAARWLFEEILPNRNRYRHSARAVGVERFSLSRTARDFLAALIALEGETLHQS